MTRQGCKTRAGDEGVHRLLAFGVVAVALAVLAASEARAAVITMTVTGHVTIITHHAPEFDFDDSIQVGTPYVLTFQYDATAPDLNPDLQEGWYTLTDYSGQAGNYSWTRAGPGSLGHQIGITNASISPTQDAYLLLQDDLNVSGTFLIDGVMQSLTNEPLEGAQGIVSFAHSPGNVALDSDALVPVHLADWTEAWIGFGFSVGESQPSAAFSGLVESVTIVPEPCVLSLCAALSLYGIRRFNRQF